MIKKSISFIAVALILVSGFSVVATSAHAQTTTSGTAPVLYNQAGTPVNAYNSYTGALNPGWYYNASGQPVYYYSNGTYYNEDSGTYGGTPYYSNGTGPVGTTPPTYTPTTSTTGAATYAYPTTTTTNGTGNMSGNMITLYNQSGTPVNTTSGASLPAGYYYNSSGQQIYYYGNGTYYDPATGTYGGSVNDPSGLAGTYYYNSRGTVVPGVPDTGAGGFAVYNWILLIVSGAVVLGGLAYLTRFSLQQK